MKHNLLNIEVTKWYNWTKFIKINVICRYTITDYLLLGLVFCLLLQPVRVFANPRGGRVIVGSATISQTSPSRLDIVQGSNKAIIDWRGFSIQNGEHTHFKQPNVSSMALNRVTGSQLSAIHGKLTANGRVMLVNPNGVLFGNNAKINVGSLIATTADIDNDNFMAGRFVFDKGSTDLDAAIINRGQIEVTEGGAVVLVAPSVANEGLINARLGQVVLAGTESFTIDFNGDGLVQFDLGQKSQNDSSTNQTDNIPVSNSGTILADGGIVQMTTSVADTVVDQVINMDGVIQARAVDVRGGSIILSGGESGIVAVSGTLDVSGAAQGQVGGEVKVLGEKVGLFDGAEIDASGDAGGGTVLVGGNFQGKGPEVNAQRAYVAEKTVIDASAKNEGDGGKVILWSDLVTRYGGKIFAEGGENAGDGGFVEVSGKNNLDFRGYVSVSSKLGNSGTILLDPGDIFIKNIFDDVNDNKLFNNFIAFDDGDGSQDFNFINTDLEALDGNIILQAQRDITVNASLDLTNQTIGERVVFQAGRHINVNRSIVTQGADIHFEADSPHSTVGAADGTGRLNIFAPVSSNGGDITLIYEDFGFSEINGPINLAGGNLHQSRSINNTILVNDSESPGLDFLNQIMTTGTVFVGQASTAGNNGLGNGANILTLGAINSQVALTLNNQFAGDLQFISNNGFTLDKPLTSNQPITINADADGDSSGSIDINAPIVTNGNDLTLKAGSDISFNADIDSTGSTQGGNVSLTSNNGFISVVGIDTTGSSSTNGGNISLTANEIDLAGDLVGSGGSLLLQPALFSQNIVIGRRTNTDFALLAPTNSILDITNNDLGFITGSFGSLTIGRDNGSGIIGIVPAGVSFNQTTNIRAPAAAGTILIQGPIQTNGNDLTLNAGSAISFSADINTGGQNGGNVDINSGGTIDSSGSGFIEGRDINLIANGSITLNGINNVRHSIRGHSIIINTPGSLTMGGLSARDNSSATTGDIIIGNTLIPSSITLGRISTRNLGTGNGGNINISTTGQFTATDFFSRANSGPVIDPNPLLKPDLASIATEATADGGNIDIVANDGISTVAGIFTNSAKSGNGGALNLTSSKGTISTGVLDSGSVSANGGDLNITAASDLALNNINTSSGGAGKGGDISVLTTNGSLSVNQDILSGNGDVVLTANETAPATIADLNIAANITANTTILSADDSVLQTGGIIQSAGLAVDAFAATLLGSNSVDTLAVNLTGAGRNFNYTNTNDFLIGKVGPLSGISLNNGNLNLVSSGNLVFEQNISGIQDLTLSAVSISANGVTSSGSQNYNGDLLLAGTYSTSGGDFNVTGNSILTADTNIVTSDGDVQFNGQVIGNNGLTILAGGTGDVVFTNDIGSLGSISVSGHSISLHDVITAGSQSYTGSVDFNSNYLTNGGGFTVNGSSQLLNDTSINTNGGFITFNGPVNGSNALILLAGSSGNILFNGDVGILNPLNLIGIKSANNFNVRGQLLADQLNVFYQGDFTTDPSGFINVGGLFLSPSAQSATLVGIVDDATDKDTALSVKGPVGNNAFTINGCTIGISCEDVSPDIPPPVGPIPPLPPNIKGPPSGGSSLKPPSLISLAQRSPPSDDPNQYQFSNLGNEELWDNNPGGYSVSSFAAFTVSSPKVGASEDEEEKDEE